MNKAQIIVGDNRSSLKKLPEQSVQTVVTSPPYWGLRDYGNDEQLGLESSPEEFIENLCQVFDEVWRVLKDDGTLWVNLGDTYVGTGNKGDNKDPKNADGRNAQSTALNNKVNGLKAKDMVGIPWRFAFAMQARGWYLRQDIIWSKPNPMPEPVLDRCTKSHEYIFLMTKSARYFYDNEAIKEPAVTNGERPTLESRYAKGKPKRHGLQGAAFYGAGGFGVDENGSRNKRDVWTVATKPYSGAHFAVYPPELIKPCILAGSREGDIVLDPFSGSGTTGEVALQNGRDYIGLELSSDYAALSETRISNAVGMFGSVELKSNLIE